MSDEEQRKVIEYVERLPITEQIYFYLYLETGVRCQEGMNLTIGQFRKALQMPKPHVWVRCAKKTKRYFKKYIRNGKEYKKLIKIKRSGSGQTRFIPLTTVSFSPVKTLNFQQKIRDYLKLRESSPDEESFLRPPEVPLRARPQNYKPGRSTVVWRFHKIMNGVGIPGYHVHSLRHTFAVNFLKGGGNLPTLQYLLGHENISTTSIYIRPRQEDVFRAMGL